MDSNKTRNIDSQFLKTDGGKTKSNAIEIPSIELPKGGGAIKGIDEKFSVNAVNGTSSFSIPLPFSPARDLSPSLSLTYNSGAGNSIFGLGWSLGLSSIKRKTNKGLPRYLDPPFCKDEESDTYLFSKAEDLVLEFQKDDDGAFVKDENNNYIIRGKDSSDGEYRIHYFRPRIEGLFARIERWTKKDNSEIKWRVITRDNVTTLFGWSADARVAHPENPAHIFEWLPQFTFDDKGNCYQYVYKKEDDSGFDGSLLHNQNRLKKGTLTYSNVYLEKVIYGNKSPYKKFGDSFPQEADYCFKTIFDYGEYDVKAPYQSINAWDFRKDAFSDYKAGFEIRTTRLCKRVLLFHIFNELHGGSALVKSVNLEYDTGEEQGFTFLKKATVYGYIKQENGTYGSKKLPPVEFGYEKHDWNRDVRSISSDDLVHSPTGLHTSQSRFTDLFNEGLSGILCEQAGGWYYKGNLGGGRFEEATLVSPKPSFGELGSQTQLMDLEGDGRKQLVSLHGEPKGYFELSDDNEWQLFQTFDSLPNIFIGDPNARMLDLNGDGKADILITEDKVFSWYESAGRKGFKGAIKSVKPADEEEGPHVVFADALQSIFLADMTGDGMTDIVRIRNGEVCYWPNMGYGRFGRKIAMDNAPFFDHPHAFNPSYLHLSDIDGSGTTDIIYLGKSKFTCWKNLSGNSFSETPFEIEAFPEIHDHMETTVTDLLGNGMACIVWSSSLSKDARSPLKYIDLMNSKKPHIMISYKNNLGKEVSFEYTPSTHFYIEDKLAGKPWITKLHFPVHCISKSETRDLISGYRFISSYNYHHGYYDHEEREFRGFGMVEQIDTEDFDHWVKGDATNILDKTLHQPPVKNKTWFHTGAFLRGEKIFGHFAHEHWYEEMERQGYNVDNPEMDLPDARLVAAPGLSSTLIGQLSAGEWREALRACKSMTLRSEVFAKDAPLAGATPEELEKELIPHSVSTGNAVIELLQPRGQNRHAIFTVRESETISYSYERATDDPRIAHKLNISLDEYGNVLESASVVYGRRQDDITLPTETVEEQGRTHIIYTENRFTNDVINDDEYRLRLPSQVKTFELKGVNKPGEYYSVSDFEVVLPGSSKADYHEMEKEPPQGTSQLRLIEHACTLYLKNDLTGPLKPGKLESKALPYESYQLAYTPALLEDIFKEKADAAKLANLMAEGKYIHLPQTNGTPDDNWWIRSGTVQFLEGVETVADAQNRFYLPLAYTDPYGAKTSVKYDGSCHLFIEETEDALGNRATVEQFNFRTLSPTRMKDPNDNLSEAIVDELGFVKAIGMRGKGNEADDLTGLNEYTGAAEIAEINAFFKAPDSVQLVGSGKNLLKHATARFVYDFDVYQNDGKPAVIASIVREEHFIKNNDSPVQLSFEYSNGLGQVVMKKVQAEPGMAKEVIVQPDETYSINEVDTGSNDPKQLRWIGNGRTVLNNKGNPVKQYEPYFSVTHRYEDLKELVETGVTPVNYYDAMGRLFKTELPDGTFSKTEFDAWKQSICDPNDTVLESSWYDKRTNRLIDAELLAEGKDPVREKEAADNAAKHANTPTIMHFDTLGRAILSIDHNKNIVTEADEYYETRVMLDIEGNLRTVTDARGNLVMEYKYDMLGNMVRQDSMDAGRRWLLVNILGNPLRTWDERNHEFRFFYDILHRPLESKVTGGDGPVPLDNIFERTFYGEGISLNGKTDKELNLRGQTYRYYDTGGLLETPAYDFKGQPLSTTRKLFKDYKSVAHWTDANLLADLETEEFTFITETDALGRITRQVAPDQSEITPIYNEAGLLDSEKVVHADPVVTTTYIKNIDYDEKGRRKRILYGNDVSTNFFYDKASFRLTRIESKRQNNDPLQDWRYTYDPVGNVTHIEDKNMPVVFFDNQKITGVSTYTYDALYRLAEATGRENNAPLTFDSKDNWNDEPFMHGMNPGDPMAVRNYTQQFQYDAVGNVLQMKHAATGNDWTRDYTYEATNNRLINTQIGTTTYSYLHHSQHGFMTSMPHLEEMGWNFKEELVRTIRQKRTDGGTAETTYYQYDGSGQRIRKITENQADVGVKPSKKEERIYMAGYELYKKHSGTDTGLERVSLGLMDEGHRFVMIETRNDVDDGTEKHLVRYQLHNHLGSASLELDNNAEVISYEEYHPYGTTAYQAKNAAIKSSAKRYRYTGMERDEESGLEYHSARYYMSWLGRWMSADPTGLVDGVNLYEYVSGNPLRFVDTRGRDKTTYLGSSRDEKYVAKLRKTWGEGLYWSSNAKGQAGWHVKTQGSRIVPAPVRTGVTTVEHIRPAAPAPSRPGRGREPVRPVRNEDLRESVPLFSFFFRVPSQYVRPYQAAPEGAPYGLNAIRQLNGQPSIAVANFSRDYAPGTSVENLTVLVVGGMTEVGGGLSGIASAGTKGTTMVRPLNTAVRDIEDIAAVVDDAPKVLRGAEGASSGESLLREAVSPGRLDQIKALRAVENIPESAQAIAIFETEGGTAIVTASSGKPLTPKQIALAEEFGLTIGPRVATRGAESFHAEILAAEGSGQLLKVPTQGWVSPKMCPHCEAQLGQMTAEGGFTFVLGEGRQSFQFFPPKR